VKRFRGGLVFKAHRLLYHSTLGLRVIQKKGEDVGTAGPAVANVEAQFLEPLPEPETLNPKLYILPHVGVRPFHQKSTCLTQLTLGPYVVQIWSRDVRNIEPTKPS